ncbi:MAG: sodium:dicarboxylate symporter [Sphingomonadales bacterium 32-68-7]|nr:MAG: sodium:dicarboxylate symporter [Sphingomonadales bacterium 12-68-11]OYX09946.1 MAG: sodium:dicarboxylate symporter [Sphingomonadales bacterium 32-68-7]
MKLPAGWTFIALIAGLALGWALLGTSAETGAAAVSGPIGSLWLRALQMTIVPLVAALLVTGIAQMIATARAGAIARRTLLTFFSVLAAGTVFAAFATPALLDVFPIPGQAAAALAAEPVEAQPVPGLGAFVESLVADNVIAAAAETAMLPLVVFFVALGVALTRLSDAQRDQMVGLFEALGNAMLVIIGWVLWLAPVGVFALALNVGLASGGGAFAALGHYILVVAGLGFVVFLAGYVLAAFAGHGPVRFARAMLPSQAVAISTQSSLASLPAMLQSCRALGLRETTADFVLPLAVALFRATGPVMNLGVAIYVAHLVGVELTPSVIAAGVAVALLTTIASVSLPGAISFVTAIGPIAIAMGVPVEPLALLVAVEMLPDIMRTLGNVTLDVAVTSLVDRRAEER